MVSCRQAAKSTTKADIAAYKFSTIGASVNLLNGEVGQNCLDLPFDRIKTEKVVKPWRLNIARVGTHKDLLELLETGKGHLLSGAQASRYVDTASRRAKEIGSVSLHPTHEWALISLTGGPSSKYFAPAGHLNSKFESQTNWKVFRAMCGDGYVSQAQQGHFVHLLVGVNVEDAANRMAVRESLKALSNAEEYSDDGVTKLTHQLEGFSDSYPVTIRIIDSSREISSENLGAKDIKGLLKGTIDTADYDNGKIGIISVQAYEKSTVPPDDLQKMAAEVLTDLQSKYLNILDTRDLVTYMVRDSERYRQDDALAKAKSIFAEFSSKFDKLAEVHSNCASLETTCTRSEIGTYDLSEVGSIRPERKQLKRSDKCRPERYNLGYGEVCRDKAPTVYRLTESSACTVRLHKLGSSINCGIRTYKLAPNPNCGLEADARKGFKSCRLAENGIEEFYECRDKSHGVESYFECRHPSHGSEPQSCRDEAFGVELYEACLQ